MMRRRPERRFGFGKGSMQLLQAEPERAGDLHDFDNLTVFDARGFQMRAADVPADRAWHFESPQNRVTQALTCGGFQTQAERALDIIPVIDLKGGGAVRARGGARHLYAPIATPLAPTSRPEDVVAGFRALFPFKNIYIADLDAISGTGDHGAIISELEAVFPEIEFWVDSGIAAENMPPPGSRAIAARSSSAARASPISIHRRASMCRAAFCRWIFAATIFSGQRLLRRIRRCGRNESSR